MDSDWTNLFRHETRPPTKQSNSGAREPEENFATTGISMETVTIPIADSSMSQSYLLQNSIFYAIKRELCHAKIAVVKISIVVSIAWAFLNR